MVKVRFFSGQQVLSSNGKLSVGLCNRRCAGRRWQVASCHSSWRDGCCDIWNLNNLHPNNTSPHATVKCGSRLHVSFMPSPPNSLHNSAGTGEAATCRRTARWHQGRGERRSRLGVEEVKDGEMARKGGEEEERGSVKVRENPQVTASVWLFRHLVPVGLQTWPTFLLSCQRLSIVPLVPWKDNQLFTFCCVLLCAKCCSFPHLFPRYFHTFAPLSHRHRYCPCVVV